MVQFIFIRSDVIRLMLYRQLKRNYTHIFSELTCHLQIINAAP